MKKAPSVRILIIGISETREQVLQYIEAGASGYVIRESSVNDLLAVIRAAGAGKALVSPEIASALIQRVKSLTQLFVEDGKSLPDVTILTKREFQILQMVSQNFNNQEIADRLVISRGTVKNHIHNILEKLCVSSRTEAVNLFTSILNNSSDPDSGK
jgi:DNA-binding NarL/FixJ family response regulator